MKRTRRQDHNDRITVEALLTEQPPEIVESVRKQIAIEFGALMGVTFRLREQLGCKPHPALVRAEMQKLGFTFP